MIYTFQDFEKASDKIKFALELIDYHKTTEAYTTATIADLYDRQKNVTVNNFAKIVYSTSGIPKTDFTASNNKIASNFFARLNTQRNQYSLGNGVTFTKEGTKEKLGLDFDNVINQAGYNALIHGVTFLYFNNGKCHNFKLTEFAPLYDEETGVLRAGVRFWQLDSEKPLMFAIYEEDGFSKYRFYKGEVSLISEKRTYKIKRVKMGDVLLDVAGENYGGLLPIVCLYGSRLKQSTLVGMQQAIDSFDLICSGFANDLQDCAQIYWIISHNDGMDDRDLARFRDKLFLNHIALATDAETEVKPYTQDIPHEARVTYLEKIKERIYEDFGALNVSSISSGARTATEIRASYQPLDENADDFEYQLIEAIQGLLKLVGVEDTPQFKRNRIANQTEEIDNIIKESEFLDSETILRKLPNITVDEIESIISKKQFEDENRVFEVNDDGQST